MCNYHWHKYMCLNMGKCISLGYQCKNNEMLKCLVGGVRVWIEVKGGRGLMVWMYKRKELMGYWEYLKT